MSSSYCVCCGTDVPEGTQVCLPCLKKYDSPNPNTMIYESNEDAAIRVESSSLRLFDLKSDAQVLTDDDIHCILNFYTMVLEHRKAKNVNSKQEKAEKDRFGPW